MGDRGSQEEPEKEGRREAGRVSVVCMRDSVSVCECVVCQP